VNNVDETIDDKHIEEILECQHCHLVGHMKIECFDLHPCLHCGKTKHFKKMSKEEES
jgi:hypothetical protein